MKIATFLVFNRRGSIRAVKNRPSLRNGEYAIRLRLECPDSVFQPEVATVDVAIADRDLIVPNVVVLEAPAEDPRP